MTMRQDLKAFVDGELPLEAAEEIRRELETNGDLAQEVAFIKLVGQEVRDAAKEPTIVGVEATLAAFRNPKRFRMPNWGIAALLAVVLVPGAVMTIFPVFAQAKNAAKSSWMAKNGDATAASLAAPAAEKMAFRSRSASPMAAGGFGKDTNGDPLMMSDKDDLFQKETHVLHSPTVTNAAPESPVASLSDSPEPSVHGVIDGVAANGSVAKASPPTANYESPVSHRMVIQNGQLSVAVTDVSSAQTDVMNYTKSMGGYVESSSLDKDQSNSPTAVLSLRVPVRMFTAVLDHLKTLAPETTDILSAHVTGEDVTGQYADTTARLNVLGAEEDSYVTMLRKARKLGEILEIKDRLSQVRQQIQSLQAQSSALKNESAMSKIDVTLTQKQKAKQAVVKPPTNWANDTWADAETGLFSAGKFVATLAIFVFVYSPIWLPIVLFGLWLTRRPR